MSGAPLVVWYGLSLRFINKLILFGPLDPVAPPHWCVCCHQYLLCQQELLSEIKNISVLLKIMNMVSPVKLAVVVTGDLVVEAYSPPRSGPEPY